MLILGEGFMSVRRKSSIVLPQTPPGKNGGKSTLPRLSKSTIRRRSSSKTSNGFKFDFITGTGKIIVTLPKKENIEALPSIHRRHSTVSQYLHPFVLN